MAPEIAAPNNLFVYGTLMKGLAAHDLISGFEFKGNAETRGVLIDVGYPGLLMADAGTFAGFVHGEMYEFTQEQFREAFPEIDAYECTDAGLFVRTRQWVRLIGTAEFVPTYVYQFARRPLPRDYKIVRSGDWRHR